jgi:tRNA pseudouridine55 synthase
VTCCRYPGIEGILNINKPQGKTSFSVIALVRRLTGEKRVGHAGTLDPMATGVLLVCIGQATRLVEYLMNTTKTYRAEIELGITTDTFDAEGKITKKADASGITRKQLETAISAFHGEITQIPPAYSAVKYHGKPSYKLARAGIAVVLNKRLARIDRIELIDWRMPVVTIEIDCGKGTYIRSLANDLGQMLGCGAYLRNLVRLRYGIFGITESITIDELEKACQVGYWERLLYPMDSILTGLPAVVVGQEGERSICNGIAVPLDGCSSDGLCRAYNQCGNLLAVIRFDREKGLWQPEKVFGVLDTVSPM